MVKLYSLRYKSFPWLPESFPKIIKASLIASICFLSCAAMAEDLNKYEAASSVHTWVFASEGIYSLCTKAYPGITSELQKDLAKWKQDDKLVIDRANDIWNDMELDYPRSANEIHEDDVQLTRLWEAMLQRGPDDSADIGKIRCSDYFGDLADGVNRTKRPEVYRLLEAQ